MLHLSYTATTNASLQLHWSAQNGSSKETIRQSNSNSPPLRRQLVKTINVHRNNASREIVMATCKTNSTPASSAISTHPKNAPTPAMAKPPQSPVTSSSPFPSSFHLSPLSSSPLRTSHPTSSAHQQSSAPPPQARNQPNSPCSGTSPRSTCPPHAGSRAGTSCR